MYTIKFKFAACLTNELHYLTANYIKFELFQANFTKRRELLLVQRSTSNLQSLRLGQQSTFLLQRSLQGIEHVGAETQIGHEHEEQLDEMLEQHLTNCYVPARRPSHDLHVS